MKLILVLLIFSQANFIIAQNNLDKAYNHVYWALILQKQNRHTEALNFFDKAFKIGFLEDSTYQIDAAYSAFKTGKDRKAAQYLSIAISKYNAPYSFIAQNDKLREFYTRKAFKDVVKNYNHLKGQFYANLPFVDEYIMVEKLRETDQLVRRLPSIRNETPSENKLIEQYSRRIVDHTDSLNIQKLMELTKKVGYLPNGYIILWHQRLTYPNGEYWTYFKSLIQREIEKGKLGKWFFTSFEDQVGIINNRTQKYGTIFPYEFYSIEDVETVDQEREKVGLPPLMFMNYIYQSPLPQGYTMTLTKMLERMEKKVLND